MGGSVAAKGRKLCVKFWKIHKKYLYLQRKQTNLHMKKSFFIILVLLMLCNTSLFAYSGKMQKAINALASLEHGNNATPEEQKRIVDMFQEIINSSKKVQPEAYFFMGEAYSSFVPIHLQDYEKAGIYYKTAMGQMLSDNKLWAKTLYNTGLNYYLRNVPTHDLAKAYELMSRAAEKEKALSDLVGMFHEYGLGCEVDPTRAILYYQQAIAGGIDAYAKYYQLDYFLNCITENKLDTVAYELFKNSQIDLIMRKSPYDESYLPGLTKAAEMGYLPAMFDLGTHYYFGAISGQSKEENVHQAELWLKKAADAEYIPAIFQLGTLYEKLNVDAKGAVTSEGFAKALPYYEKTAQAGYAPAQCALAFYEYNGLGGLKADPTAARIWFQISADQGYTRAKQLLAKMNEIEKKQRKAIQRERAQKIAEAINNISNSISCLLEKRQNMSAQQNRRMQNTRTKTPENISLSEQDEKNGRNPEQEKQYAMDVKHYNDWRKLLLQMYIGEVPYDNTRRIKMQSNMRELREKYDGHRLLEWKPCHLETWDGERDH